MGNLITYKVAFDWTARHIDRNDHLIMINDAIILANGIKDNLYYHPRFYTEDEPSLKLFNDLWSSDFDAFKMIYPWIKELQYQILTSLPNYFKPSPNNSRTLIELKNNTGINNNAWIGFKTPCPEYLVFDEDSWKKFHSDYVATFNRAERLQNREYFIKYYVPSLKVDPNRITSLITKKQVHKLFKGLNMPNLQNSGKVLHNENIHIHFNDANQSSLNINGVWKHRGFDLPNDVCEQLIEWGFILPENLI